MYRYLIPDIAKERVVNALNGIKKVQDIEGPSKSPSNRHEDKKIKFSFNFYAFLNRQKLKSDSVILSNDRDKIEFEGCLDVQEIKIGEDEILKLSGEFGEIFLGVSK